MLLETITALVRAGGDALQTTCGLTVTQPHISLVRQGSLTFPSLGELHIRNGTLQRVHLGSDTALVGQLAVRAGGSASESGIERLAHRFLQQLLDEMEGRNPRGSVENLAVAPLNLATRGLRTFGFRLETEAGQLFLLAEIPSKAELEIAKNSDFMAGMIATYLPREWRQRETYASRSVVDSVLVFLRKVEQDLFIAVPGADGSVSHPAFVVANGSHEGQRALLVCVDLQDGDPGPPGRGDMVRASFGVEDRSLEFDLPFLGESDHPVAGAHLPCAWFGIPEEIRIGQRRRAFRMPLEEGVEVEIESGGNPGEASPWADEPPRGDISHGRLADLSFSGARIVLTERHEQADLEPGQRVRCLLHLPDQPRTLGLVAVVRRATLGLADRNAWQEEIGVEFVVTDENDRDALVRIRDFVLSQQRSRLAHRIHVGGARTW